MYGKIVLSARSAIFKFSSSHNEMSLEFKVTM